MDLKLALNNSSNGLYWLGVSGRELGKLGPGACMEVELTLLAATPGLQVCDIITPQFENHILRAFPRLPQGFVN